MGINYWAVLVCAVFSMVLGSLWYGRLFGKAWMKIMGVDAKDVSANKKIKKGMWMLYLTQFILTLFQVYILANLLITIPSVMVGVLFTVLVFLAFVIPTLAGNAMWSTKPRKIAWAQFGIQFGYQLILFVVFGFVLSV